MKLTHILEPCHKVLLNWPVFADHLEYLLQSHNIPLPYKYAKLTLIRHLLWPIFYMISIDLENDLILEPVLFPRTPLEHYNMIRDFLLNVFALIHLLIIQQ